MMKLLVALLVAVHTCMAQTVLKDILPGGGGSTPDNLTVIGSVAYFSATDGKSGIELYKTDGTTNGTTLIKDINKTGDSNPHYFTPVNGRLLFVADDGTYGEELWVTDGTTAGTKLVKDIRAGVEGSSIGMCYGIGSQLYFVANDGVHGLELWKSDGTATGTVLVRDFRIGITDGGIESMAVFKGKLYFTRTFYYPLGPDYYGQIESSQMWYYDPSTKKANPLFRIANRLVSTLTAHNQSLYFGVGDEGEYDAIYKMNPDEKGCSFVSGSTGYRLMLMRSIGGKLFVFGADEYSWYDVEVLNDDGTFGTYLDTGVQDVVVSDWIYFGSSDYENVDGDVRRVTRLKKTKGNLVYSVIATYKDDYIRNIELLGKKLIYTAYDEKYGNELRVVDLGNTREEVEETVFKAYPNPASDYINIEADSEVELYDIKGIKLNTLNSGKVDLHPYSNGLYILRSGNKTIKLLIE
jgi:ELWxxDGT repeat protein